MSNDLVSYQNVINTQKTKEWEEENIFNLFFRYDIHNILGRDFFDSHEERGLSNKLSDAINYIKDIGINNIKTPIDIYKSSEISRFDDYFDIKQNKSFIQFVSHLDADKVICLYKALDIGFDFQDNHGNTILHYLAYREVSELLTYLIRKYGANYLVKNNDGLKPIDFVGMRNRMSKVFYFLETLENFKLGKKL